MNSLRIWWRQILEDFNARSRRSARRWIRKIGELILTDLELMGALKDAGSSAAFARQHLRDVPAFKTRDELFRWALAQIPNAPGLFLEFGVYKGNSINRLAAMRPEVTFHGFDSFVGLPEAWTLGAKTGAFDVGGNMPAVRENVRLIKGFFETTLAPFLSEHPDEPVRFLHVDCDLYSATKTILDETRARLGAGAIIVFDEFFNYPTWQDHEIKAFHEFVVATNTRFDYIGYVRDGQQVAVKLL